MTGLEVTRYMFDINADHYREALMRFADFFIAPLLDPASMKREISIVDSEWQESGIAVDKQRLDHLLTIMASRGHPMSRFTWGNCESLSKEPAAAGINSHKELKKFNKKYYVAQNMTLAIQAKESLDTLQEWVTEIFSPIQATRGDPTPDFSSFGVGLDTPEFHRIYKVVPVSGHQKVVLLWALPRLFADYKKRPLKYICYVLNHRGPGSIISVLLSKRLATRLVASCEDGDLDNSTMSMVRMRISLTSLGLKKIHDVGLVVFQFMYMLRFKGSQESIWKEMKRIDAIDFDWSDPDEAYENVTMHAIDMHHFDVVDYLTGSYTQEYDPALIDSFLEHLIPEKMCMVLYSHLFDKPDVCPLVEKWFRVRYNVQDYPLDWMNAWTSARNEGNILQLPRPNPFIPQEFVLKTGDKENSQFLTRTTTDHYNLFYRKDEKFTVPKAYVNIYLRNRLINRTPLTRCLADFYVLTLKYCLDNLIYLAAMANLDCSVAFHESGILLCFAGFNDKLQELFHGLVDKMSSFEVRPEVFITVKETLASHYHSMAMNPDFLNKELRRSILYNDYWTILDKINCLPTVCIANLEMFAKDFCKDIFCECLVEGNVTFSEATDWIEYMITSLNMTAPSGDAAVCFNETFVTRLPTGMSCYSVMNENRDSEVSVISNYYQYGQAGLREHTLNELLVTSMEEPSFVFLRTQKRLGYTVDVQRLHLFGIIGFTITVQSQATKFTMQDLDNSIEEFLVYFMKRIDKMKEKAFRESIETMIDSKSGEETTLKEQVNQDWQEILRRSYQFQPRRDKAQIEYLKQFTLDDFKCWCRLCLAESASRQKLSTQVVGNVKPGDQGGNEEEGRPGPGDGPPSKKRCCRNDDVNYWRHALRPGEEVSLIEDVQAFKIAQRKFDKSTGRY